MTRRSRRRSNSRRPTRQPRARGTVGATSPIPNGRARSNPQTDREPVTSTPPQNGNAARQGQGTSQSRREVPTQVTPAEQQIRKRRARGAPDQKGNVVVQDARPSPRVQGNPPDADRQGKTRANPARANKQGDTKNADDQEKADERRRAATAGVTDTCHHVEGRAGRSGPPFHHSRGVLSMADHPLLGAVLFAIGAVLVAMPITARMFNLSFSDISSPSTAFFSLSWDAAN